MNPALDSRARFEAWVMRNPRAGTHLDRSNNGTYKDNRVAAKWTAWQAAIASMAGWQPIADAPKDGSEFLAVYGRQGNCMELARWCPFHSCWKSGGSVLPGFMNNATAWQPLPAPPTPQDPPIAALAAKETT